MLNYVAALLLATGALSPKEEIAHATLEQKQDLTIQENLHGGKLLVLSDNSRWEVAPQDLHISETWIIPVPLKIEKSNNPSYPYQITNLNSRSTILARSLPS